MLYNSTKRKTVAEWTNLIRKFHPHHSPDELISQYGNIPELLTAIENLKKRNWFAG